MRKPRPKDVTRLPQGHRIVCRDARLPPTAGVCQALLSSAAAGLRLCPQALGLVHTWRALGHTCWMDDSAKAREGSLLRGV